MINVILCGGSGTRLWPLSRTMLPKQFVRLFDGHSLFQDTLIRNQSVCNHSFIVSNTEQFFLAADQLSQVASLKADFLLEPIGRNTAPAIALACLALEQDDVVLVTTSDHLVKDQKAYEEAVIKAKALAEENNLVTFGIRPTYPETGFGYIEASDQDVLSFKEKPDVDSAKLYLEKGNYFWNSGMFCFKAGVFLKELERLSPEVYQASVEAINLACEEDYSLDSRVFKVGLDAMQNIPEDSIDYAVMEKSDIVKVVPCDMGWSDLGSFDALYDEVKASFDDNAVLPRLNNSPEPICVDAKNNLLVTRDRQIALIDVEELLVVDTSDAILISKRGSSQKVKQVVAEIKKSAPELAEVHRLAHRPWGTYEVLVDSEQYKVKRIVVKPGSKLSLQKHFHRNEHWIVVSGTATVTVNEERFLVRANESTYIQMGQLHRLENEGKIDLVMIEVQVGEYTGEDDIVRVEDVYGR
ncbi:mannose-1-phosphate guanylyltransferase/mannose-6-phosphate isomerase [Hydrogenovibrio marinus]|uniref:mannose-1-phosphate guanylyltransferase n=1 Tax=Hydrogenovibrio marinus TaxID=28885 RepID=A0A066ZWW5_HYDMR|nr:mannose-1-phosphate guanylyltransferase/mannose-6-phosphate isomerase [Hydrogenovibrio marinus]KDN96749.1 mannose-6-phosphate isomerase [Hydrogenovibrio marinus]BBN58995.1 xanthan biosynthesis protein XanB [Hydrogenovibrio marinus]